MLLKGLQTFMRRFDSDPRLQSFLVVAGLPCSSAQSRPVSLIRASDLIRRIIDNGGVTSYI